jgi:hypothetical protein
MNLIITTLRLECGFRRIDLLYRGLGEAALSRLVVSVICEVALSRFL